MTTCPPAEHLAAILDDGDAAPGLEHHLSDCPRCQQTLLGLAVGATELQRQEQLLRTPATGPGAPPELLTRLKQGWATVAQHRIAPGVGAPPVVPGYEIEGELGRGGMAVVYRARHLGLNRPVALKVVLAGRHASPELRSRFRREAEAVARLRHPGVVQVFDVGESDGLPFLAMELVEGGTLRDALRDAPLSPTAAAELIRKLAGAVQAAHAAGVIHRDLKPANILLRGARGERQGAGDAVHTGSTHAPRPAPRAPEPMVADFGLALQGDTADGWTRTGDVLGTPAYMAPEQAQGRRADVGPGTDVHALGVILYEALTGRTPFAGADDVTTLLRVSFDEPVPPRRLRSTVPRDLETICLKCLRKSPSQRYPSALDLAADLGRFLTGEPIKARPVSGRERVAKWVQRNPGVAALLGLVVVVTAAGFAGVTTAMLDARSARDEEFQQRGRAERALDRSERSLYLGNIAQARSQWLLNNVAAAAQLLDRCAPERRDWEWHYLRNLNHGDLLTVTDDTPWVTSVAYSPDGQWLASCGGDPNAAPETGTARVFNASTGAVRWRVPLSHLARCVAYSPDGRTVAVGGENWRGGDGFLELRDAMTGDLVRRFPTQAADGVNSIAFGPGGRLLAVAHPARPVRVYDTSTGNEVYKSSAPARGRVSFTPDGRYVAFDGASGLELHDPTGAGPPQMLPQVTGFVTFSPDGARLVAHSADQVSVSDVTRGPGGAITTVAVVASLAGHEGRIASLSFRPDGQAVATAGYDGTVRLRELGSDHEPLVFRGHTGRVTAVAFHPDGRLLATGGTPTGDVKVWDATRGAECVTAVSFAANRRDIAALGFAGGDRELLVLSLGGILRRWDCRSGATDDRELPCSNSWLVPATPSAFSADGTRVAAVGNGNLIVRVLETATGREVATLNGHTVRVRFVACDRECRLVATAAHGSVGDKLIRELKVWDATTGKVVREVTTSDEVWDALALSPDGDLLLTAVRGLARDANGRSSPLPGGTNLALTSLRGGDTAQLTAPGGSVTAVGFSPRGRYIAAAGDGGLRIFDRDAKAIHEGPLVTPGPLGDLAFNPDETRLAGVTRERVQVWDVTSGQDVLFLRGTEPRPSDNGFNPRVAWSHDGTKLVASNWNRTASVWDAADASAPAGKAILAAQVAGRAFEWHYTRSERFAGVPFAAEFHRRRLLAITELTPAQWLTRCDLLARSRQWAEARAACDPLFATGQHHSPRACEAYGALLLKTGDEAAYRALRTQVLALRARDDTADPQPTLRLGGLLPTTKNEAEQLLGIARRYQTANTGSPLPWECLGLAHYRAGDFAAARSALARSREMFRDSPAATTKAVLALVALREGKFDEAAPLLKDVDQWLADQEKWFFPATTPPETWDWVITLQVEILRAEAEKLRGVR